MNSIWSIIFIQLPILLLIFLLSSLIPICVPFHSLIPLQQSFSCIRFRYLVSLVNPLLNDEPVEFMQHLVGLLEWRGVYFEVSDQFFSDLIVSRLLVVVYVIKVVLHHFSDLPQSRVRHWLVLNFTDAHLDQEFNLLKNSSWRKFIPQPSKLNHHDIRYPL